jgi:hypothetical protein
MVASAAGTGLNRRVDEASMPEKGLLNQLSMPLGIRAKAEWKRTISDGANTL